MSNKKRLNSYEDLLAGSGCGDIQQITYGNFKSERL